jgi:hypothetical protein
MRVNRPAADADPYLHYLAGLVHGLELRVDGVQAVVGELRARLDRQERALRVLNEQLLDLSQSAVLK